MQISVKGFMMRKGTAFNLPFLSFLCVYAIYACRIVPKNVRLIPRILDDLSFAFVDDGLRKWHHVHVILSRG